MLSPLRQLVKTLPTLMLAFALSLTVWISAVTAADPTQEGVYPRPVAIEVIGQDPGLVLLGEVPSQISLTLSAPRSIFDRLVSEPIPVRAVVDLSGLDAGSYSLPVQVQIGIRPVEVVAYSPRNVTIQLEKLASRRLPIQLIQHGELAVGYQAESPRLSQNTALVSGAESLINKVTLIRALLDLNRAQENIHTSLTLQAVDKNEVPLTGVSISPERVTVTMDVTRRGGFRNVVVKVIVKGQVASGYRVTNISVFPPAVTVFSNDPRLVDDLPGFVDTAALDLSGLSDDLDILLPLDLPPGVTVVGEQTVAVQVGVDAIEGSITLQDMRVEIVGLRSDLDATLSPQSVDVIISGPLPVLERLTTRDIRVIIDLTGDIEGTYQRVLRAESEIEDLRIESILPGSLEVTITRVGNVGKPTPTPTVTPTRVPSPTPTPVPLQ